MARSMTTQLNDLAATRAAAQGAKGLGASVYNALYNAVNKNTTAAATANAISEQSQKTAMGFNAGMANAANQLNTAYLQSQQAYNTDAAAQANALNQTMWQQTADYNSAQAAANREWQEYMSSTAYQRAVKDLRAAGLNPILAAFNGGASIGSGATGSTAAMQSHAANSGLQGAESASIGLYTGVLENTSNTLALAAAMLDGFGALAEALKKDETEGGASKPVLDALGLTTGSNGKTVYETNKETADKLSAWFKNHIYYPSGGNGKIVHGTRWFNK